MAKRPSQSRFAYDFELPVQQLDEQIEQLEAQACEGDEELAQRIKELASERDELLGQIVQGLTPFQRVRLARHPLRPQSRDHISRVFDHFLELHGDRRFGDDKAVVTGLARLQGRPLMLIAQHKGKDIKEKVSHNYGMPNPEGYRKALAKMDLAERFGLPVVCLIDTPGAAAAVEAEQRGQAMAIAANISRMTELRAPIIILIIGEGCSGGMLGIGVGDRFAMLENAYFSVISPEGCAAILWRSADKAEQAAEAMKLTAQDMLERGIIDMIVPEPLGGAHRDPVQAAANVGTYVARTLDELAGIPMDQLLQQRYEKYRALGEFTTV